MWPWPYELIKSWGTIGISWQNAAFFKQNSTHIFTRQDVLWITKHKENVLYTSPLDVTRTVICDQLPIFFAFVCFSLLRWWFVIPAGSEFTPAFPWDSSLRCCCLKVSTSGPRLHERSTVLNAHTHTSHQDSCSIYTTCLCQEKSCIVTLLLVLLPCLYKYIQCQHN